MSNAESLRKALKFIQRHCANVIRTNSKDRGDWAEDMAYVGKVAADALAQPTTDSAEPQGVGPADFEAWWSEHGQFCRAGGGDYEKTFAFRAWNAARDLDRQDWNRVHHALAKHGKHPGRTDDHLADVIDRALSAA